MTEQNTNPPQDPPTPPTPAPRSTEKPAESPKRFAVYDKTYLRYVGDVHDTKAKAEKDAKARKIAKYEIREV